MATDARTSAMSSAGPEKLGYAEYCMLPADDNRHEIIDGEHVVTPAPSTTHQTVSKRLLYEIYTQLELTGRGLVFAAPVDVQLTEHDIVQPDLVVILKDRADPRTGRSNCGRTNAPGLLNIGSLTLTAGPLNGIGCGTAGTSVSRRPTRLRLLAGACRSGWPTSGSDARSGGKLVTF
jgi:hypothetical protein